MPHDKLVARSQQFADAASELTAVLELINGRLAGTVYVGNFWSKHHAGLGIARLGRNSPPVIVFATEGSDSFFRLSGASVEKKLEHVGSVAPLIEEYSLWLYESTLAARRAVALLDAFYKPTTEAE